MKRYTTEKELEVKEAKEAIETLREYCIGCGNCDNCDEEIKKWCVKTNKQNCLPCDWNVSEVNEVERLKDLLKKVVEDSVLMFHAIDGEDRHTCDFCHAAPCASRECKYGIGCRWRYEKEIRDVLGEKFE